MSSADLNFCYTDPMSKLTKEQYQFLDKVGVGQIEITELNRDQINYLRTAINRAVSVIPFKDVEGMEEEAA